MKDVPTYLKDSYVKDLNSEIIRFSQEKGRFALVLKDTVFYPEGGGQPCDQGLIESESGKMNVKEVKLEGDEIVHYGKVEGDLNEGQKVHCQIDWDRRYKNMLVHSAGHLLEEAMYDLGFSPEKLVPIKASHAKKPYVEYRVNGKIPASLEDKLDKRMKEIVKERAEVSITFVTKDEIEDVTRWTPEKLPTNKPLRVVRFGERKGLPDGGTLVKNSSEIPDVSVSEIEKDGENIKIYYEVDLAPKKEKEGTKKQLSKDLFPEIKEVWAQLGKDFSGKANLGVTELKTKYLGKKGIVKLLLRKIGDHKESERKSFGQQVNNLRQEVESKLTQYKAHKRRTRLGATLTEETIDVTAPFGENTKLEDRPSLISKPGTLHPITNVGQKALNIFQTMGFHVTEARILDSDYNVFESLNIPAGHPARDMWDTFWTEDGLIPTTHTSAMQNRIMRENEVPIREVIVGRCFRNEATDASHEHTFYQVEGVYVDKGITLADLIGTLSTFMNTFYGRDVKYRIQPSYFPFVEPGLEFMIECMVCGQKGCPFCGFSGWVELVPCGPVHPNVLREGGYDPEVYSGFAWGLGYDRLVMLASQIEDIRNIHSGDLKFLEQFK